MGLTLNYFSGDYKAINQNTAAFPGHSAFLNNDYRPLYSGGISSMITSISKFNSPILYNYKYDQLNRLTAMDAYNGYNLSGNNWNGLAVMQDYNERVSYDGNGNILKYLRNGNGSLLTMDSLTYNYNRDLQGRLIDNKLNYIRDRVNNSTAHNSNYPADIDDQSNGNYTYDAIGNLTGDAQEGITGIIWNVNGKIREIQRNATGANPVTNIQFEYDAGGNRISKRVQLNTGAVTFTWYVRDVTGNIMAVYNSNGTGSTYNSYTLTVQEQNIYGSARLGIIKRNIDVKNAFTRLNPDNFVRGNKLYELSNHLGNVMVAISDKKKGRETGTPDGLADYFEPDIISAVDYYPFGMQMPGRTFSTGNYRFGFNGKENDNDVKGAGNQQDYGMRIYDPRVGKFLSVDPLTREYPWYTPYQFAGNMPIKFVDLDGAEPDKNPKDETLKSLAAKATVVSISRYASEHDFKENVFSSGMWSGEAIQGTYSCSPTPILTGGMTTKDGNYVSDNTDEKTPNTLNVWVSRKAVFNVNESNAKKFDNYEAAVVAEIVANFMGGVGPENYNFPTNGIISSKFLHSDVLKEAISEYKSGKFKPNETKQFGFGLPELFKDAVRNWTFFSITGMTGSATITFIPDDKGITVRIFNVMSLSSGALIKNPNDIKTFPNSYVRDPKKDTDFGNISTTFNLYIPNNSDVLK
jgi:RHS repeat-associated protein